MVTNFYDYFFLHLGVYGKTHQQSWPTWLQPPLQKNFFGFISSKFFRIY